MGQVTIYLDDGIEAKMMEAAKSANLSPSEWVTRLIQENLISEWPQYVIDMAGGWSDFPEVEEIRSSQGQDLPREIL